MIICYPHSYYALHLANVGEKQAVKTSRPVYDSHGELLLDADTTMTLENAKRLANSDLDLPIEELIAIESPLTAKDIHAQIFKLIGSLPGLQPFASSHTLTESLNTLSSELVDYPTILQKLTVLSIEQPRTFFDSLFSAVASTLIALKLHYDTDAIRQVFIAALIQDIGMLHINPQLLEGSLRNPEVRHAVSTHPAHASHFLKAIATLPRAVGRIVEDHHERNNGTGYPKQKFGDELSEASQIVAITSAMITAHHEFSQYGGHTHQLIAEVLKLNSDAFVSPVFNAALDLMQQNATCDDAIPCHSSPQKVADHRDRIATAFHHAKEVANLLVRFAPTETHRSISTMSRHLRHSVSQAKLLDEDMLEALEQNAETEAQKRQLTYALVAQNEICRQLETMHQLAWNTLRFVPVREYALHKTLYDAFSAFQVPEKLEHH